MTASIDHWRFFTEFCRYERLAGGPDPHMACVGEMAAGLGRQSAWDWCGVYIACYNVPTAEILYRELPARGLEQEQWIRDNWAGLAFRRERRPVRTPAKLARYMESWEEWASHDRPWMSGLMGPHEAYEAAWRDVLTVWGLGRYVALKALEFLRRYAGAPIELPDIRPAGGWSPRQALALLYPEHEPYLNGDDRAGNLAVANGLAFDAQQRLWDAGVEVDLYNLQVLLCDYKQSAVGQRQYPGRSLDSEMVHARKVHAHFGNTTQLWEVRSRLFPAWALGELNGWDDVRPLGPVLAEHGYTWSDRLYDWNASKDRLDQPVRR